MKRIVTKTVYALIVLVTIVLDHFTKNLAVIALKDNSGGDFALIQDIFHFTYHENRGAAFGMLSDNRWVFMSISVIAILAISAYLFLNKDDSPLMSVSLAFILGGGIGNMIDRVFLGYVIDFLNFKAINFPIFNVADSFVTIGAALLIVYMFKSEKSKD